MVETLDKMLKKNSLRIQDTIQIPPIHFVEGEDLTVDDEKEISHPAEERWMISLVDSLRPMSQLTLYRNTKYRDLGHYNEGQRQWINRHRVLLSQREGRLVSEIEAMEDYHGQLISKNILEQLRDIDDEEGLDLLNVSVNSIRYKVIYSLLYPEMVLFSGNQNSVSADKFRIFLEKSDEIAAENYRKNGAKGLIDYQRGEWAKASREGKTWIYEPCYEKLVMPFVKHSVS